jgi:hypothetical protein
VAVLVTIALVAYQMGRGRLPAPVVPDMGNAGNIGLSGAVRAPDISQMSPRERFDRLVTRIATLLERRQVDSAALFAPMALGAYAQLDRVDADARYHAAQIQLMVGQLAGAKALADTILAQAPTHLFGHLVRAEVAEAEGDSAALRRSREAFLRAYETEIRTGRPEYEEHRAELEDFRKLSKGEQR